MKALSIRQPWAWLIVNRFKDIENRTWSTRTRGEVLIHASLGMTQQEYEAVAAMLLLDPKLRHIKLPDRESLRRGGIVGKVTIKDSVTESTSPWYFGPHGFVLEDACELRFTPMKGALGFFNVPDDKVPV